MTKGTFHVAMRLSDGTRLDNEFPSPTPVKLCGSMGKISIVIFYIHLAGTFLVYTVYMQGSI